MDAKTKRMIRKNGFHSCGYVYKDGIVITYEESHVYRGEVYRKKRTAVFETKIPVCFTNSRRTEKFVGRLVFHNPTLLLGGIKEITIYRNNSSEHMKDMGITCDTLTIETKNGMKVHEHIFTFMSSDIVIQNNTEKSVSDWQN